jgi:malate synthase
MMVHMQVQVPAGSDMTVLTRDALEFLARLQRDFGAAREQLLVARQERQRQLDAGAALDFLEETASVREGKWTVPPSPADLTDRRVEITGPAEPKMTINALNSGAKVFMADLEDALSPTWANVVGGQATIAAAVRRTLTFDSPEGKAYRLNESTATLVVRPRGWHLTESHALVDGQPMSASLFDFGLFFFHNAQELLDRGSGPYLYLPKLESHLEARLWNDVFLAAQDRLGIVRSSIRATVLVETLPAAFEMDEILWELREHAAGLNAGRWDYLFSSIKKLRSRDLELPDRAQLTMTVPFMRAYTELLVQTCHKRGAHAIGGMAAFIPSRRDAELNATALARVREDKDRESGDGFDGTWVAHPDLVPVAREVFDRVLGDRPHQKESLRAEVVADSAALADVRVPGGTVTEAGVRNAVSVALQYLDSWLQGNGAAAINNLMEDAATAEISRALLWVWRRGGTQVAGSGGASASGSGSGPDEPFSAAMYLRMRDEELAALGGPDVGRLRDAAGILDSLVTSDDFVDFLTLPAYGYLR